MGLAREVVTKLRVEADDKASGKMREGAARTRELASAQRDYGKEVDRTTGKLREQLGLTPKSGGRFTLSLDGAGSERFAKTIGEKIADSLNKIMGGRGGDGGGGIGGRGGIGGAGGGLEKLLGSGLGKAGIVGAVVMGVTGALGRLGEGMAVEKNPLLTQAQKNRQRPFGIVGDLDPTGLLDKVAKAINKWIDGVRGLEAKIAGTDWGRIDRHLNGARPLPTRPLATDMGPGGLRRQIHTRLEDVGGYNYQSLLLHQQAERRAARQDAAAEADPFRARVAAEYDGRLPQWSYRSPFAALAGGAGSGAYGRGSRRELYALKDTDRSTFQGDLAYQEEQRRLPLIDARDRAEAAHRAAVLTMQFSGKRLNELRGNRAELRDRVRLAREEEKKQLGLEHFGGRVEPAKRQEAGRKAQLAEQAYAQNEAAIAKENARLKERGVNALQAESNVRKANIALAKEELSILQAKEQRLAGQAQGFGRMNALERQMALQAARRAKAVGIGNLLPQERALVERGFGAFAAKEYEKFGEGTAEYKAAQQEGFLEKGLLRDVRERIGKVQTNVRIDVQLDEEELATKIAKFLDSRLAKLLKDIDAKQAGEREAFQTGLQLAHAAAGGAGG